MSDSDPSDIRQQMRQHPALVAGVDAMRTRLKTTYREYAYSKTIEDLDGESFEPLAGIRVTVHSRHFDWRANIGNRVFMADYVEYLTGINRAVVATVELIDGYVPTYVNKTAFIDSLRVNLEALFNACGYTLHEDAPDGLRQLSKVTVGNTALELMFSPLRLLKGLELPLAQVTVVVEDGHIVLRVPIDRLFENRLSDYSTADSIEPRWNRVHRSALGELENLGTARIWAQATIDYCEPVRPGRAFITDLDVLDHLPSTYGAQSIHVDAIWEVNSNIASTIKALPDFARGVVSQQILTVYLPIDFAPVCDQGHIVFEDVSEWVEIVAYNQTVHYEYKTLVPKAVKTTRGERLDIVNMRLFDDIRNLAATALHGYRSEPDVARPTDDTSTAVEPTDAATSGDTRMPPPDTFRARLARAIATFRYPLQ